MRYIIICSYMGSGSSAVTNLLEEYKNLDCRYKDFEYVFLHTPNGLLDLEDKLLHSNNVIRSDEAIKSFRKAMYDLYNLRFWWVANYKNKFIHFKNDVDWFINKIKDFEFQGKWYFDEYPNFIESKMRFFKRCLSKIGIKVEDKLRYNEIEISYISKDSFYEYSYQFIDKVFNHVNSDKVKVLDQLLLPHNLYKMERYFHNDAKAIVVERDPRDVFILNKYIWSRNNLELPYPMDVKQFCNFYDKMRKSERKENNNNILRIKFEDMIFSYDKTINKIEKFLGLSAQDHINYKKFFNPDISINNLCLYADYPEYNVEIKVIQEELQDYLYDFEKYDLSKKDLKKEKF